MERELVPEKDTLTARVGFSCNWLLKPDTLETANKIVYKNLTYGGVRPSILFTDISIDQDHLKIYFTSSRGGIQNKGTVNFECIDNNYVFNEITYKRGNE